MDQLKIGKFIAVRRKEQNLTQAQLAERLGITDRAVSKWERGLALPDVSAMPDLCRILDITVNDLLSGEIIAMDNYTKELERNLLEVMKQKEENDKKMLTLEWVIGGLSMIVLFIPILIGALVPMEEWLRMVIVFSGFVPAFVGFFVALRIEQVAGYYHCEKCGHKYVPSFKEVTMAMHMGRTRYLKCPACGQKSWQKKVISKE